MFKSFIAGITALLLTVVIAAPAQANGLDEDETGKILFGLFANGIAADIINNAQNNGAAAPDLRPERPRSWYAPRETRGAKILPRTCLQSVDTRFGDYRMFVRRCMQDNYQFTRNLPGACAVRVVSYNGPRNGWDAECLRERGYRASRRNTRH